MAEYDVVEVPLDAKHAQQLVSSTRGQPVGYVTVIALPLNADVGLHFGSGGKKWPLKNQGQFFKICPAERDGVYVTSEVAAGNVVLGISFGGQLEASGR